MALRFAEITKRFKKMTPYYAKDGITIYHDKCERVLPFFGPVDLLLTDPPYGIGEAAGKNKSRTNAAVARDYGNEAWDDQTPSRWLLDQCRELAQWQIIFGGNFFEGLPPSSCWLVWDKDNTGDFADCELAWTNLDKAVRKLRYRWNGMLQEHGGNKKEPRLHPTQKPLAVIQWALSQAPAECRMVLDPFMGVGTTLVAAKLAGMSAIGIEQNERYCELAADRLRQGVLPLAV